MSLLLLLTIVVIIPFKCLHSRHNSNGMYEFFGCQYRTPASALKLPPVASCQYTRIYGMYRCCCGIQLSVGNCF